MQIEQEQQEIAQIQYSDFEETQKKVALIEANIKKVLLGQDNLIDAMILCLLCQGHILLEGFPGLAKTLAVKAFAKSLSLDFRRVQFTADLLPSDITGTQVFLQGQNDFSFSFGPVFCNVLLADEINRAAAKVQSALLEAMAENQVTVGGKSYPLQSPFIVLATQNPIDTEGTYRLPEAQLDRFLLKVNVDYPDFQNEMQIATMGLKSQPKEAIAFLDAVANAKDIKKMQQVLKAIKIDTAITEYALKIIRATRTNAITSQQQQKEKDISGLIQLGASPRAFIDLLKAASAFALFCGRSFVIADDVIKAAPLCLPHRLVLSYEAVSQEINVYDIIAKIIKDTPLP